MQSTPPIAFALNTKDRTHYTTRILPALDISPSLDLYWFDGSESIAGANLPSRIHFAQTRLKEIHYDIVGGADVAIQYALNRMLAKDYHYLGLIENDVLLEHGWLTALLDTIDCAQRDGLTVGAASVRTIACRCLLTRDNYAPMWNMGAGMVLFTREGANAVLADYRGTSSREVNAYWQGLGFELHSWDLWRDQPDRVLGADWWYAAAMFKRGLVSVGSVPTFGRNIDFDIKEELRTNYVILPTAPHMGQTNNARLLLEKHITRST